MNEKKLPKIYNMCGRRVLLTKVTPELMKELHESLRTCGACGTPVRYLVTEIASDVKAFRKSIYFTPVWGWCGECEVGE